MGRPQSQEASLTLLDHEDEGLVVVRVEVGVLHRRLLLLPNPLPLGVQQLDLDVRICKEKKDRMDRRPTSIASVHLVMGCPNARAVVKKAKKKCSYSNLIQPNFDPHH